MRHLHLEFICASLSLGLAVFFFGGIWWQLFLLGQGAEGVLLPLWFSLILSIILGGILLMHAVTGIQTELKQPKHRRHAR